MEENGKSNNVYIGALKLRNIKCFKGEHIIDFTDKEGKLHQWTVILGNNNTGKTTILRAITDLIPNSKNFLESYYRIVKQHETPSLSNPYVRFSIVIESSLSRENVDFSQKTFRIYEDNEIFKEGKPLSTLVKELDQVLEGNLIKPSLAMPMSQYETIGLVMFGYGVNRRQQDISIIDTKSSIENVITLFNDRAELANPEEWLIQFDYAQKNGQEKAGVQLEKIKRLLTSGILPDVQDFRFVSDENFKNYVEFKTDYGWVRLHELGYGYRSSIAWIVDLAKKMFERYPDSENPLAEAAVVLVDELDLHLHPEWQRKIISFLTKHFPNTQFIVTAHSPLVVQSAERVNIVLLNKEEDHVTITQPNIPTYKGWSVEEILSELMNLGERTHSDAYLQLMDDFESALDKEDFEGAQKAYDQLSAILHPDSPQRKLLRMQMSAIVHD